MQTVSTKIRRRVLRRLIWVYTILPMSYFWESRDKWVNYFSTKLERQL